MNLVCLGVKLQSEKDNLVKTERIKELFNQKKDRFKYSMNILDYFRWIHSDDDNSSFNCMFSINYFVLILKFLVNPKINKKWLWKCSYPFVVT